MATHTPGNIENIDEYPALTALSEFQPIETERLYLRLLRPEDAPVVQQLAGAFEIAKTVINIPHPYEDGVAELWIDSTHDSLAKGRSLHLAITIKDPSDPGRRPLIGAIGLEFNHQSRFAELGYWLGVPYWNKGYTTEAARALVAYGFETLLLNRIQARHMTNNPASGRVMQKIGMTYEGTHRQAAFRFGEYHDLAMYSILRSEYERSLG